MRKSISLYKINKNIKEQKNRCEARIDPKEQEKKSRAVQEEEEQHLKFKLLSSFVN